MAVPVKVSVIIPVYNTEKYLRQCLDSIANQTLKEIEVICVNDGSTDSSLKILEEFERTDKRFKVFTKENEGMGAAPARNYGLERAKGKYISFLDSDDFFETDMLEKSYRRAEVTEADIVIFGGYEHNDKNGKARKVLSLLNENALPEKEVFSYRDCPKEIYQLTLATSWNKLFRRSFLEKRNLRFQRIKYTDDIFFIFSHMVLAEKIAVLREDLCYYRVNTDISQTDGVSGYPDSAFVPFITLKNSLIEWGIYEDVKQSLTNYAVEFMRYVYDRIEVYDVLEYLHDKYRNEIFYELDIVGQTAEYFYDKRLYEWCRQIIDNSASQLVFKALRAHGGENIAVLRMLFPYEKIPGGSRVAIIGAETLGRHYYSQIMLNRYCDVVLMVAKNKMPGSSYVSDFEALRKVEFDYALIASAQHGLIDEACSVLRSIGFPEDRIIYG